MLSSILSFVWNLFCFLASVSLTEIFHGFSENYCDLGHVLPCLVTTILYACFLASAVITFIELLLKIFTFLDYINRRKLGQAEEVEGFVKKRNYQKKNLFNQRWEVVLKYEDLTTTVSDESLYKALREGDKVHLKVYTKKTDNSVTRTLRIE